MGTVLAPLVMTRFGLPEARPALPQGERGDHLIVYLDRAQSTGIAPGRELTPILCEFGDLLAVHYPIKWGFGAGRIAREVHRISLRYKTVTLIGEEIGALVAHIVLMRAQRSRKKQPTFRRIVIDAPGNIDDISKSWLAALAQFIPAVPTSNEFNRIIFRNQPVPECECGLSPEALEEIETHYRRSLEFPVTVWARQMWFAARRADLRPITNTPTVYLQSYRHPVIRSSAYSSWQRACGKTLMRVDVRAPGHSLLHQPTAWGGGLRKAFELLAV